MRIGILGCGYVGQAAARYWEEKGYHVTAATRREEKIASLREIASDVRLLRRETMKPFLSTQDALLISVAPDASSDYRSTYLQTASLIAQEVTSIRHSCHILYTSSLSVYGDHQGNWVDETTPPHKSNQNAQILLETEQILLECSNDKVKVCIFRLGGIYGPGREVEDRLKQRAGQVFAGTGSSYTNLIHLTDIIAALDFSLEQGLSGIYNLCNDFHFLRKDWYEDICTQLNLSPIKWDPSRECPHSGNKRASNQKLKLAGFRFSHPLWLPKSD